MHDECTHASACGANCAPLGTTVVLFVLLLRVSQWTSQIYGTWNQGYDKTGEKPTGFWSVSLCLHFHSPKYQKLCKHIPVHVISSTMDGDAFGVNKFQMVFNFTMLQKLSTVVPKMSLGLEVSTLLQQLIDSTSNL